MSDKQLKIMETIGKAVSELTELELDRLLAFSEGIAFMAAQSHQPVTTHTSA